MSTEKKKKLLFVIVAIVAFVAAVAAGYFYKMVKNSDESSDSSITKVESSGEPSDDVDVSLQYAGHATLLRDDKIVTLNFTNPSKSKKSLSLEIVANIDDEDLVLAKTSKIDPGYKIDSAKYELNQEIPEGKYEGKFIVYFYNEQGNKEIINSEISIDIYVK